MLPPNPPATTFLVATAISGQFAPYANIFLLGVSGDYVAITTAGEGPSLIERLGPARYVAYSITATTSGLVSGMTTISVPFTGAIEYCELKSEIGQYYYCSPALANVREQCSAPNGR